MKKCLIYWVGILDELKCVFVVLAVILFIASLLCSIIKEQLCMSWAIAGVILLVCQAFIPSTKHAAVIIVAPWIVINKRIQQLPDKFVELINDWIDEISS